MLEGFEKYNNLREVRDSALRSGRMSGGSFSGFATDAAVAGGLVFLQSELEKLDPKVREPLTSVTWMRDMPIKSGGGWLEFTSQLYADYATSGPNMYGLVGGQTTTIPIIQTNISKDVYRVYNWENVLKVNFIDMQKLQGAGRSLEDLLDKGIKLNWNKALDLMVYQGFAGNGGLVNNSAIAASSVAVGAAGKTGWIFKTPLEIMYDVNTLMISTWVASQYDVTGMADSFLIPAAQFGYLANTPSGISATMSILTYLLENNIGKTQGRNLKIFPSRWCVGAGSSSTDRMVAYVNEEDRVKMDVTVPIQRIMTTPNISSGGGAYFTLYGGQIGVVKVLFPTAAAYGDGI